MLHTHKVAGSNPARNIIFPNFPHYLPGQVLSAIGFYGVMVSTLDFESSDPSSNLGRTYGHLTLWRNGSASDSRSEGCVFKSRRGHGKFLDLNTILQVNARLCLLFPFCRGKTAFKFVLILRFLVLYVAQSYKNSSHLAYTSTK